MPATFDVTAYAGQTVQLRIPLLDGRRGRQRRVCWSTRSQLGSFFDGAESATEWLDVHRVPTDDRHRVRPHFNAYVAEFRQYRRYDTGLQTGPYNFGFLNTKPDWVEHFPYQDGMLVSYWNTS